MSSRDLFSLSIKNLFRRKTRTLLAVIGVVVGTCAIIVMLSIGFGLSVGFQAQIESYGNLHLIDVYSGGGGYVVMGDVAVSSTEKPKDGVLDDKAIAEMGKIPGVEAASAREDAYLSFGIGKFVMQTSVVGIAPEMMQKFGYEVQDGRLLMPGDKFTVVFGNQVPSWFYNPKKTQGYSWGGPPQVDVITDKMIVTADDRYGQKPEQGKGGEDNKITYKEYKAKGVGILNNPNDQSAYTVYMPLETVKTINADTSRARKESSVNKRKGYNSAMVYVTNIEDVVTISESIRNMGFQAQSLNDWLESMKETARMIQGILGGIGAISLLVAALGITNTMIMSIYERTKEIGVMKVIGANLPDIKKMFLIEAGMIGLLGGLIGMIFSYLISLLMNTLLSEAMSMFLGIGGNGTPVSIIPWWVSLGAIGFATVIGIISGYYPAKRAMKLSALESLRNE